MPVVVNSVCDTTIVEVYSCGGGGGGNVVYVGVNLGAGAEVYKETDQEAFPREHKFRSLVAGPNVTIAQLPDEIVISATGGGTTTVIDSGGGVSGRPLTQYVGAFDQRCGLRTTSFTPYVDLPDAQVGDMAVWIVYFSYVSGVTPMPTTSARVAFPDGWELLVYEAYSGSQRFPFVAYKFLTEADLTTTFTANSVLTPVRTMCSHGYAFREVHRQHPFGTPASSQWLTGPGRSKIFCAHPLLFTDQHIVQVMSNHSGNLAPAIPRPWDTQMGPTTFLATTQGHISDGGFPDVYSTFVDSYVWRAPYKQDENWFGDETKYSTLEPTRWTAFQMTRTQGLFATMATLDSSGISSRHHLETTVSLVAGQKYSFWIQAGGTQDNSCALTITDPASNERAAKFTGISGSGGNTSVAVINDPLSDHGSVWIADHWGNKGDGVPSTSGGWNSIFFTALTTGTYTLRVAGYLSGSTLAALTFNGPALPLKVSHACFRRGWHTPSKQYSPFGPVMEGDDNAGFNGQASCVSYINSVSQAPGGGENMLAQTLAFPINPAWTAFPLARASDALIAPPGVGVDVSATDDGLKWTTTQQYLGDEANGWAARTNTVWPRIDGAYQKYYCEVKCDVFGTGWLQVAIVSTESLCDSEFAQALYTFNFDAVSTSDVLGVLVDYTAGNVKWYVNNVLSQTDAFPAQTYPTTGIGVRDRPLSVIVGGVASTFPATYHDFNLNLAGPFDYPPAADVLPFDSYGDPNVFSGTGAVQNLGNGVELGVTGPNGEVMVKSLVAGTGIALNDSATEVIISAVSPLTTKGDLFARSTVDARLPVGNNGDVLVADSTEPLGLKWAAAPSLVMRGAAFVSTDQLLNTVAPVTVHVPSAGTITRVVVIGDVAGSVEVGIKKVAIGSYTGGTSGSSIVGADPPTISSGYTADKTSFTGWTLGVAANDVLNISLTTVSLFRRVTVQIYYTENS